MRLSPNDQARYAALILFVLLCLYLALNDECYPATINVDLDTIIHIESRWNPLAYNKATDARGLAQITPVCLTDYNQYHTSTYSQSDLWNPQINMKVAYWYISSRIPALLSYYKKPHTLENYLISYNAGVGYVVRGGELPRETVEYIERYKRKVGR